MAAQPRCPLSWRATTGPAPGRSSPPVHLGYASHAPLDVLTSYGTLWWWPFSRARLESDRTSIVDPLFTIPPLLLTVLAMVRTSRRLACAAALFAFARIAWFAWFAWFADGFVARDPADPSASGDMRFSLATEGFEPPWGVRFHRDGRAVPVEWDERMRHRESGLVELWQLVTGTSPHLRAWLL